MVLLHLKLSFSLISLLNLYSVYSEPTTEEENGTGQHNIEGKISDLSFQTDFQTSRQNWFTNTRIHVNGGELIGFVKNDGSFVIHNVPSGSHLVEVLNPEHTFEPVRVEINSKGKYRARKVNRIERNSVIQVPYPLRMKPLSKTKYFQMREQWRITDFIFNPMILMMVLPLLLVMLLPKMMNDPETKKEMEQIQNLTNFELSDVSDKVSNFLAGGTAPSAAQKKNQKAKKRQ